MKCLKESTNPSNNRRINIYIDRCYSQNALCSRVVYYITENVPLNSRLAFESRLCLVRFLKKSIKHQPVKHGLANELAM